MNHPDIGQARRQIAESVAQLVREEGPQPADALIDKLYGQAELTAQERHDVASLLYATQRACRPINPDAMVHKAVRLDGLLGTWTDVFGEAS